MRARIDAMSSTRVSIVVPAVARCEELSANVQRIAAYFGATGLEHEIVVVTGPESGNVRLPGVVRVVSAGGYGAAIKRGAQEAHGSIILIVDPSLPYTESVLGDAVAMIDSATTDIVFGVTPGVKTRGTLLLRFFLVPTLPDGWILLKAFSAASARVLFSEAKLTGAGFDLELAFLANKYGFRIEELPVAITAPPGHDHRTCNRRLADLIRIRMANRQMAYRAARRCPVCYSSEVWTQAQVAENIVRACRRCKIRYLARFREERELALQASAQELEARGASPSARLRTSEKRLAILRKHAPAQARVLDVGAGDATFGSVASKEFEYTGIDASPMAARDARMRGVDVYCATLEQFVNTGSAFDVITLFHVFECLADPHDALARVKELLKPGGIVFLTAFDTESLMYLLFERDRLEDNFRTRLILYSQSALIELFERSGFEILSVGDDFEYRDRQAVSRALVTLMPRAGRLVAPLLAVFPDPMMVGTGSIRIIARRRSGPPVNIRPIRSAEPTHAR
jgi:2-polyprenyl-3-methyl-5-hydroxy-6-metoxy-1,4-benzoquinol methylase